MDFFVVFIYFEVDMGCFVGFWICNCNVGNVDCGFFFFDVIWILLCWVLVVFDDIDFGNNYFVVFW